jgi:hypothetical protein
MSRQGTSPIPLLTSYLDESSDATQQQVFCVAASLAVDVNWVQIEKHWTARLAKDGVAYFRATSCKSVTGPFLHLRQDHGSLAAARLVAQKIRVDLEDILLSFPWAGFMLGVILPDYKEILKLFPEARGFFTEDPTEHAYSQVIYEVTRTVRRKAKTHGAAFVIDHALYADDKIINAYEAMRTNHPTVALTAKSILPLDDKYSPRLQVADLLASVTKDMFLDWQSRPEERYAPLPNKWRNHIERIGQWDKEHFLRTLIRTLSSPRLSKGTIARRTQRKHKLSKREQKKLRKQLTAKLMNDRQSKSK